MLIKLDVPYIEKDLAKEKGARWNPIIKTWFAEDITKIVELSKWINEFNIICESIYILMMERTCWKCKQSTEVICLCTDKSYAEENGNINKINTDLQLLSYVLEMPSNLANYMKDEYLYFPSYSKTVNQIYYVNHCKYCRSIQGDNYLHEIPEESFYKKLCYTDSKPISFTKIKSYFSIPLYAQLPSYDEVCSSELLLLKHLETGFESRSSLNISQNLINKLFSVSNQNQEIEISWI